MTVESNPRYPRNPDTHISAGSARGDNSPLKLRCTALPGRVRLLAQQLAAFPHQPRQTRQPAPAVGAARGTPRERLGKPQLMKDVSGASAVPPPDSADR
jgi:hypothetical protein